MAKYAGNTIENLSPVEAGNRGYLMPDDVRRCTEWVAQNLEQRQNNTLVYVNGVYVGVAKTNTPLYQIVEKFKIQERK